jgi:terminase large subunit-like protein
MVLTTDAAMLLDPTLLAARAGFTALDDWQQEVLRTLPPRLLLNTSRQTGKSFVAALLAVHQAIYAPGSLAVVVAVAQRQAAETIRVCRDIYAALDRPVPAESENKLSLELDNRSRILSVPSTEATIRGLSKVGLLILDEASRIPDVLYGAVLPFLAVSDGRLALLSTPAGRRGFFFDAYQHRDRDGWFYKEVRADECKRISNAFLAEQRRKTGEYFYAQEWECAFNDATTGAFRSADIDRAVRDYPTWNLSQYERREESPVLEESGSWNLSQYQPRNS